MGHVFRDGELIPDEEPRVFYRGYVLPATSEGRVDLHSPYVQSLLRRGVFVLARAETIAEQQPPHPIEGPLR